jgi:hypothetical protein
MNDSLGRRTALRRVLGLGAIAVCAPILGACSGELTCSDISELSSDDIKTRTSNEYVDKSPNADKHCSACKLFKPAGEKKCGACELVKGPINPNGYCKSWTAKT